MQTVFWVLAALAATIVIMPAVIALSWRIGALDIPGEARRIHKKSVPRIGGLAIFLVFSITALLSGKADRMFMFALVGAAIVFFLGFADDLVGLPAWIKCFFQSIAAAFYVGSMQDHSWIGAFAAFFWILLLTNAHNLVDGMDGLFARTAMIESLTLALAFVFLNLSPLLPLLLAATCGGFYWYNRSPARIFAGDCGSGSVGFLLGVFSAPLFWEASWSFGILAPVFIMAYPVIEVFLTILRRGVHRKPIFAADRGHLHHQLLDRGFSNAGATNLLGMLCASFAMLGVLFLQAEFAFYAAVVCLFCGLVLFLARRAVILRSPNGNVGKTVDFL